MSVSMIVLVVEGGTGDLADDDPFATATRVDEDTDRWVIAVVGRKSFEVTGEANAGAVLDALSATLRARLAAGGSWHDPREDPDAEEPEPLPDPSDLTAQRCGFALGGRGRGRHRELARLLG